MVDTVQQGIESIPEAVKLMADGKRHMLVHDYNMATQCFEEACKLLDTKFGIESDESAEAYLNYGISLFELSRIETGAFDTLINSKVDEADVDDEEEEEEEEEEGEGEGEEAEEDAEGEGEYEGEVNEEAEGESKTNGTSENGDEAAEKQETKESPVKESPVEEAKQTEEPNAEEIKEKVEEKMLTDEQPGPSSSSAADDGEQPSTSTGVTAAAATEEEEAEASSIEVAWEVLSMAKKIYERQMEYKDGVKLYLAESLQKLGEVYIEWDNFESAIESLNRALELRKEELKEDDRMLAETYFNLGLAYSFKPEIEKANDCFQLAINVIETRISNKKEELAVADESSKAAVKEEIKELEDLLPEIQVKIEDPNAEKPEDKKETEAEEQTENMIVQKIAEKRKLIEAKPIGDITPLLKRKKVDFAPAPKANGETNGVSKVANGDSNGVDKVENTAETNGKVNGTETNGTNGAAEHMEAEAVAN